MLHSVDAHTVLGPRRHLAPDGFRGCRHGDLERFSNANSERRLHGEIHTASDTRLSFVASSAVPFGEPVDEFLNLGQFREHNVGPVGALSL